MSEFPFESNWVLKSSVERWPVYKSAVVSLNSVLIGLTSAISDQFTTRDTETCIERHKLSKSKVISRDGIHKLTLGYSLSTYVADRPDGCFFVSDLQVSFKVGHLSVNSCKDKTCCSEEYHSIEREDDLCKHLKHCASVIEWNSQDQAKGLIQTILNHILRESCQGYKLLGCIATREIFSKHERGAAVVLQKASVEESLKATRTKVRFYYHREPEPRYVYGYIIGRIDSHQGGDRVCFHEYAPVFDKRRCCEQESYASSQALGAGIRCAVVHQRFVRECDCRKGEDM